MLARGRRDQASLSGRHRGDRAPIDRWGLLLDLAERDGLPETLVRGRPPCYLAYRPHRGVLAMSHVRSKFIALMGAGVLALVATACAPDTRAPDLDLPTPHFLVGDQIGTSGPWEEVQPGRWDFEGTSFSSVPRKLDWRASDNNGRCTLKYDVAQDSGRGLYVFESGLTESQYTVTDSDVDDSFGIQMIDGWVVTATDCAGNSSSAFTPAGTQVIQQDGSRPQGINPAGISYSPDPATTPAWQEVSDDPELSGWSSMFTDQAEATVSFTRTFLNEAPFGLVMTFGPDHGRAVVHVDGRYVSTIDAYAPERSTRRIALSQQVTEGDHTVSITNYATPGHPRMEIDAFLVGYRRSPLDGG